MKRDAEDIGQQTMSGLKKGIEDYSPQALSAAERVANQVSEKMRKALEIHSPSRVMRDKVGRFIPEGVAVGINRYANKAYDAVNNLSEGLLKPIVPEFAAGGYNIGATSGISQVVNNNYSNGNSNVLIEAINKLSNRPIVTNIDVDSTNVARATSRAMTQEQYYNERTDNRMRGILI